jgi:hypothetical protein
MDLPAPADIVVMELPTQHAQHANQALESCRLVLGFDRCRSSNEGGPAGTYYASIEWQPGERVRVEVHRERLDGPLVNAREVEFAPDDTLDHRYRAIGLLVVSNVMAETERSNADSRKSDEALRYEELDETEFAVPMWARAKPPEPEIQGEESARAASSDEVGFGVDLGGHVGMGPTSGLSRFGAFLRPWALPFDDTWRTFARVGWIVHSGSVDVDGYEGALGLGFCVRVSSAISIEVNASGVVQHLRFRASDPALGADAYALTRYGARVGFEAEARLVDHIGLWLGGEVLAATPPYAVDIKAERVGQEEGPKWGGVLGLRFQR